MSIILSTCNDVISLDVVCVLDKDVKSVWLPGKIASETRVCANYRFRALGNRNRTNQHVDRRTSRKTVSMLEPLRQCGLIEPGCGVLRTPRLELRAGNEFNFG